ncbi:Hypothetical predicted protein [Olea europaea subsp. europaea]|uniref:Uncharacterized protein n=1 Tax=Olea europaea subsp. europaea TaxID=158383 RepID=A0A8S0T5U0_OLEEU|nr:Hypothetical predicted protein [Olea europaea subsp. europaea]
MASSVCIDTSFSDLNDIEFLDIDSALLESLLEESPMEAGDDEILRNVIQSLEEEISDNNLMPEIYEGCNVDDCSSLDLDLMDSCSTTSPDFGFGWTADYMTNYLMEHSAEVFEGIEDYSQDYGVLPFEEMGYTSLWQETYQYTTYG